MRGQLDKKGKVLTLKWGTKASSVETDGCSGRMVNANESVWPGQRRPAGLQDRTEYHHGQSPV